MSRSTSARIGLFVRHTCPRTGDMVGGLIGCHAIRRVQIGDGSLRLAARQVCFATQGVIRCAPELCAVAACSHTG
ncbi:MAG TPA: hypothetical protein VFE77_05365, partial [Rhodanobacter sp.]|nr:hypothetical protein [Rhodanobacter sp.]